MSMFTVKENFRQFIKFYPITAIFVSICSIFLIVTLLLGGFSDKNFIFLGAYEREFVNKGEYWRLLSNSLLHANLLHFFLNMFFILIFARPIERVLGKVKYFLFILNSILFSSIAVHLFSNSDFGLGASGFGYGLFGMYFYIMLKFHRNFIKYDQFLIFTIVAVGFLISFLPGISFWGHTGGFFGGIFFAAICFRKKQIKKFYTVHEGANILS